MFFVIKGACEVLVVASPSIKKQLVFTSAVGKPGSGRQRDKAGCRRSAAVASNSRALAISVPDSFSDVFVIFRGLLGQPGPACRAACLAVTPLGGG